MLAPNGLRGYWLAYVIGQRRITSPESERKNGANIILLNVVAIIAHKLRQELGKKSEVPVVASQI